ncbi:MAG: flagellar protein FlaG [Gemmatimonadetes bacterium]|nr:flagellar protein FlaG [Gemmatimonadota bacterium]
MDLSSLVSVSRATNYAVARPAEADSVTPRGARVAPAPVSVPPATRGGEEESDQEGVAPSLETPESRDEVKRLVDEADRDLKMLNERLGFRVHEETGQLFVQVVDRNSGEVIRESPPREFLDLMVRMREMVGVFLDETT